MMVLHQLGHEAVDGAARGGKALEGVGARFIVVQSTKNPFELPMTFIGAVDQVQFFGARGVRHFACLPYGGMDIKSWGLLTTA